MQGEFWEGPYASAQPLANLPGDEERASGRGKLVFQNDFYQIINATYKAELEIPREFGSTCFSTHCNSLCRTSKQKKHISGLATRFSAYPLPLWWPFSPDEWPFWSGKNLRLAIFRNSSLAWRWLWNSPFVFCLLKFLVGFWLLKIYSARSKMVFRQRSRYWTEIHLNLTLEFTHNF